MTDYGKLFSQIKDNASFLLVSLLLMVAVYAIAFAAEKLIEKKTGEKLRSKKIRTNRMTVIAMLSALAFILMYFEIPLWFAPSFYKLDVSEVPVLLGAFMFGPTTGVVIEAVKILLHVVIQGTSTAFVGDFANFIFGCTLVIPASFIYFLKKNKKDAIVGMIVGSIVFIACGTILNAVYLLPKYSVLYGMPMDVLIGMGTKVNGAITDVFTFVAFAVAPFNLLKSFVISVITAVLYPYVSKILKSPSKLG